MDKPTGFTFGSPAAKPAGGFSFGAPASTPAVPGAAPPAFNLTATPSAPGTGFSFGTPATTAPAAAAPALSFGLSAPSATLAPAPTAATSAPAAPAPTLSFGGFGLGKPAAQAATAPITSSTPSTLSSFASLGQPTASLALAATTTLSSALASNPLTLPGTSTAAVSALAPASTTTVSNPLTNLTTSTTTTQSSATATQPAGTQLNFCQLEEHINKWTLELEEQEKMFANQATQINAWDRVLIENSDKIVTLNDAFTKVKLEQKALEHELEYVAAQHAELDECIKPLEMEMSKSQQFDPEREQTYLMAESLDTQLKQMGEDLKEVIEHLNEANKDRDPNDPIVQIGKILNAHMSSLQWIENSTSHITSKLETITKLQETLRDNERSFRLNI